MNQPEKAQHFSFNHPVAQELLICFKPELQNHIKVRFVKMLFQIRPASHIRDIAILNGGDSLELAVIPHRLLQGEGRCMKWGVWGIWKQFDFKRLMGSFNFNFSLKVNLSSSGTLNLGPEPQHRTLHSCVHKPE